MVPSAREGARFYARHWHSHFTSADLSVSSTFVPEEKSPGFSPSTWRPSKRPRSYRRRGVRAETVAANVVKEVRHYLAAGVAVGRHLADQLILPFALAGDGSFLTLRPSLHVTTNIAIVKKFLDVTITSQELGVDRHRISLG